MAKPKVLLLILGLLAVSEFCSGQRLRSREALWRWRGRGGRFGGREEGECQIDRLDALEPDNRVQGEAGVIELWDHNHEQFRYAGVALVWHIIEPDDLLLPSYTNAPQLIYVVEGRGIQGVVIPGCLETFQTSQQSQFGFRGRGSDEEFRFGGRGGEEFGRRGREGSGR